MAPRFGDQPLRLKAGQLLEISKEVFKIRVLTALFGSLSRNTRATSF
jgi:hypothetical protein